MRRRVHEPDDNDQNHRKQICRNQSDLQSAQWTNGIVSQLLFFSNLLREKQPIDPMEIGPIKVWLDPLVGRPEKPARCSSELFF
jgi:hypothetical protein